MSFSPPLTPPHGDTVHEVASPVGEPDEERELTPTESVRERADGETSPPLVQSSLGSDKESEKEKEAKNIQDLDKDIDAMFDYNANGYADSSVSIGHIPVDSFDSTLKDISFKTISFAENEDFHVNGNEPHGGIVGQESKISDSDRHEDSEKSFTSISTTNSSVLAEAVVNRVLTNAVMLAKEGEEVKVTETKALNGDMKVGLFHYQADDVDLEADKGDGEESKVPETVIQTDPGDIKVGLFQYFDDADDNVLQSLTEADADDFDDKLESLNLSDQENILQLYGLGGPEVTESRRMSTPPSSPRTEAETRDFFIDVQREIYEPQKRMFSVTQDKSSTESTPRDKVFEVMSPTAREDFESDDDLKEDNVFTETVQEKVPSNITPVKTEQEQEGNISVREDEVDSEIETEKDQDTPARSQAVSIEVAPPLVQYESVKENGKFRIIKMPKEAGGPTFGTIRVGADNSGQSPHQSPRETEVKDMDQRSKVEASRTKQNGIYKEVTERNVDIEGQLEKPLNSVSQTLPVVTPSSSSEVESQEKLWLPSESQVVRSLPDSKELQKPSRQWTVSSSLSKEPGLSRSELGASVSPAQTQSSRSHEDSRSLRQLSEKQASPRRSETDSRIKYSITDTSGRKNKRTGPVPYSMEEYRDVPVKDYSYRHDEPGRRPTSYEAELIQSAYNRVADRTGEPVPKVVTSTIDTGPIPGYKTLQEQQARWASMFQTLEEQHKMELTTQYERHQYNIHSLQQQMESELQKQHQTIRKKLDIHKEALRHMSPERDSLSPERGFRSPLQEHKSPVGDRRSPVRDQRSPLRDQRSPGYGQVLPERDTVSAVRSQSSAERMTPVRSQRSPERSRDRRSRSADGSLERQENKTWREIYKEVREEEERRDPTPPPPIKRSLEGDFATIEDTTLSRSRSSLNRSAISPRARISPDRERILQGRERISPDRDRVSPERDVYKGHDRLTQETPERLRSGVDRESRSRTKRSPQQLVPPLALDKEEPDRTSPLRPTAISPHVQELLDNLNEGRSSLRGLQSPPLHVDTGGAGRPRAGVYSSPMPLLTGKVSMSTQSTRTALDASTSLDHSRSLPCNADRSLRSEPEGGRRSREPDTRRHDDSYLSSSSRLNLREKHSKHLADLRSYYEEELRELRRALTDSLDTSGASADQSVQSTIQNQLLEAENKHLLDKCRAMEDELDDVYQRIRELEQKGKGLEKRASEYAAAFADSQAMGGQNRAHIEELQRYCRERDDLVNDLEAKVRSQEDAMKIYKKNLEGELELHRQDKSALQRIIDKYESMEREQKLLHETMNSTENKLYETRTEVVELNRTVSKLELENKRLGRENDNLRHKVTQSINLTSMHESFGSPPSPRQQVDPPVRRQTASPVPFMSLSTDLRVPSFAAPPEPRPKSAGASGTRDTSGVGREKAKKSKPAVPDWKDIQKENVTEIKDKKKPSKSSSSRENLTQRPRSRQQERDQSQERQLRDATPPRPTSVASPSEPETGDYSPLIKAERELYRLRDMMRQAVAVKPASSPPPEPVLQKKFYGSERPSSKDDYVPDFGTPRGKREKQPSSHTSVVKTKANTSHSRQERSSDKDKSSRKSTSSKYDKNSKLKDKGSSKERSKDAETQMPRTPPKKEQDRSGISVKPDEFNSPTRFDININEDTKTLSVKKVPQSGKQKNLFAESNQSTDLWSHDQSMQRSHDEGTQTNDEADQGMQQTLDKIRAGNYMTRPQWEDVFTSLAQPKPEQEQKVKAMTREDKIKDRLRSIGDMEHRYDALQAEKRQLESRLTKIPLHGRVDRNNRRQKEEVEERLDVVEKELGSLRMSLKRCNVLKTVA